MSSRRFFGEAGNLNKTVSCWGLRMEEEEAELLLPSLVGHVGAVAASWRPPSLAASQGAGPGR